MREEKGKNKQASKKETKRCLLWGMGEFQKFRARRGLTDYLVEPSVSQVKRLGWLPGVRVQGLPKLLLLSQYSSSTHHVIFIKCIKFLRCQLDVTVSSTSPNRSMLYIANLKSPMHCDVPE